VQAMVTLKGSTAEAMTLAFCAYVTEGLLEILADEELRLDEIGAKAVLRVSGVLGEPLESADLRAMAMRIRTATLELPPVSVRIGNVQMALPAEVRTSEEVTTFDDADRLMAEETEVARPVFDVPVGVDGWSMPTTWPEFGEAAVERLGYGAIGDVMGVLAEFGVDELIANADYDLAFDPAEMWDRLVDCAPPTDAEMEFEDEREISTVDAETGEVITAWKAVDRVMTKADLAGGWGDEPEPVQTEAEAEAAAIDLEEIRGGHEVDDEEDDTPSDAVLNIIAASVGATDPTETESEQEGETDDESAD